MSQQESSKTPSPKKPQHWFSFSLFNLMFMSAFLVTVISHVFTSSQLKTAKEEVRKYRNEVGYIDVEDENRLHVKAIRMIEPKTWRWRVFVPEGRKFELRTATKRVPYGGFPVNSSSTSSISSGEILVNVVVYKNQAGQWMKIVKTSSGSSFASMDSRHAMIAGHNSTSSSQSGQNKTESVEPGQPMVLLRLRAQAKDKTGKVIGPGINSQEPIDGLMIWIEEK